MLKWCTASGFPDTITIDCRNEYFQIGKGTIWEGRHLYELYGEAYTPWEWHPKLKAMAQDLGLELFSTPFDLTAVDFLEEMGVPAYKIASFELVDLPLIRQMPQTGKPIIMSTDRLSFILGFSGSVSPSLFHFNFRQ